MLYLFTVTVAEDYSVEQYADAWVRASRLIQQAPGARGTRLHRKLDDPRKALAIASWDAKADRDAMEADPPEAVKAIIAAEAPHVSIELIGEFDDPAWVVLPGDGL